MQMSLQASVGRVWRSESSFMGTSLTPLTQRAASVVPQRRQAKLKVENFKFMKDLGLKKPGFLPDFGKDKRKVVLDTIFTGFDSSTLSPAIAEDVTLSNAGKNIQTKTEFITLLEQLKGAAPDWSWQHETTGAKDDAGFSVVNFQGSGTFNGNTFAPPTVPPIEPYGKDVSLEEQSAKIAVEDGVVKRIEFLSNTGALLDQLYMELGGKIPLSKK